MDSSQSRESLPDTRFQSLCSKPVLHVLTGSQAAGEGQGEGGCWTEEASQGSLEKRTHT